jgi:thymidine kinase
MDTSDLYNVSSNIGWIEVVCGCMFSGKTEDLICWLRRAQIAKQRVAIFKPKIDTRCSEKHITSHSEQLLIAQVVGIDEGQFFKPNIVDVCYHLADQGKRVIVAGHDQDCQGKPFEPMPQLLAIAEYTTKTLTICVVCGNPAEIGHNVWLINTKELSLVQEISMKQDVAVAMNLFRNDLLSTSYFIL